MRQFIKWLQHRPGFVRVLLVLYAGLNLYSAHRIFPAFLFLAFAHLLVAIVLLLGAILIH